MGSWFGEGGFVCNRGVFDAVDRGREAGDGGRKESKEPAGTPAVRKTSDIGSSEVRKRKRLRFGVVFVRAQAGVPVPLEALFELG